MSVTNTLYHIGNRHGYSVGTPRNGKPKQKTSTYRQTQQATNPKELLYIVVCIFAFLFISSLLFPFLFVAAFCFFFSLARLLLLDWYTQFFREVYFLIIHQWNQKWWRWTYQVVHRTDSKYHRKFIRFFTIKWIEYYVIRYLNLGCWMSAFVRFM
jgi:glucan phosphoethanolaminetransferase (alkaline phosphatase superfamily)